MLSVPWLDGRRLEDATLAAYLAELHDQGRAPASASTTVTAACLGYRPDPCRNTLQGARRERVVELDADQPPDPAPDARQGDLVPRTAGGERESNVELHDQGSLPVRLARAAAAVVRCLGQGGLAGALGDQGRALRTSCCTVDRPVHGMRLRGIS